MFQVKTEHAGRCSPSPSSPLGLPAVPESLTCDWDHCSSLETHGGNVTFQPRNPTNMCLSEGNLITLIFKDNSIAAVLKHFSYLIPLPLVICCYGNRDTLKWDCQNRREINDSNKDLTSGCTVLVLPLGGSVNLQSTFLSLITTKIPK